MNPLVSIVVPCYKQAHFLEDSLQSVLDQTYGEWECIIVNDGSPDNTEAIAKKWVEKDSRFSYLFQENKGLPSARNEGIKRSAGEFIVALDSDDILDPEYINKLLPVLLSNTGLGIVSCYRYFFSKTKTNVIFNYEATGSNYYDLMFENKLMPASLYRKKCWEAVGGYDESMTRGFEDWEFWLNISKRGWDFTFVEEYLFYYRKAKQSMLVDTINNHAEGNMEYIFRKHKELYISCFDNTTEVLFYYIKTHRLGKIRVKNSIEFRIGNVITKPFKWVKKIWKFCLNAVKLIISE